MELTVSSVLLSPELAADVYRLGLRALELKDERRAFEMFRHAGTPMLVCDALPPNIRSGQVMKGGNTDAMLQLAKLLIRHEGRNTDLENSKDRLPSALFWLM